MIYCKFHLIFLFRIYSGCVRMPSMDVERVEDTNLNVSDFEAIKESRELFFNIKG